MYRAPQSRARSAGAVEDVRDRPCRRSATVHGSGHRTGHLTEMPVGIDQARKHGGPCASSTTVSGPRKGLSSASVPSATIRPPRAASAPAWGARGLHRAHIPADDQQLGRLTHRRHPTGSEHSVLSIRLAEPGRLKPNRRYAVMRKTPYTKSKLQHGSRQYTRQRCAVRWVKFVTLGTELEASTRSSTGKLGRSSKAVRD